MKKIENMSEDEAKSYVRKKFATDIVFIAGAAIGGGITGTGTGMIITKQFVGIGFAALGIAGLTTLYSKLYKVTQERPTLTASVKSYKQAIKSTISFNNNLIKMNKNELKKLAKNESYLDLYLDCEFC